MIVHSFNRVEQKQKKPSGELRCREWGKGQEGDKIGRNFHLAPGSFPMPDRQPHKNTEKIIGTMQVAQRSFW